MTGTAGPDPGAGDGLGGMVVAVVPPRTAMGVVTTVITEGMATEEVVALGAMEEVATSEEAVALGATEEVIPRGVVAGLVEVAVVDK